MKSVIYTKEAIVDKLLKMYPNREISKLTVRDKILYNVIQAQAKKENMKNKEYLNSLGFKMVKAKRSVEEKLIEVDEELSDIKCNRCGSMLPKNNVTKTCPECTLKRSLKNKEKREIRKEKHKCSKCGVELPENSSYVNCKDCRKITYDTIKKLRLERKKNHECIVCGVTLDDDYKLKMCEQCNGKVLSKNQKIGRQHTIIYNKEYIIKLLTRYYGDNKNINGLQQYHKNLYYAIYRNATKLEMTVNEYLESTGYQFQ